MEFRLEIIDYKLLMLNYKCEDKRADLLSGGETKRLAQASGQHESCNRGISAHIS